MDCFSVRVIFWIGLLSYYVECKDTRGPHMPSLIGAIILFVVLVITTAFICLFRFCAGKCGRGSKRERDEKVSRRGSETEVKSFAV